MYSCQLVFQRVDATPVRSYAQDSAPQKPLKGDGMLLAAYWKSDFVVFMRILSSFLWLFYCLFISTNLLSVMSP